MAFITRPDYCSANDEAVKLTKETGVDHIVVISSYLYIVRRK
jgi:hypothetical protein